MQLLRGNRRIAGLLAFLKSHKLAMLLCKAMAFWTNLIGTFMHLLTHYHQSKTLNKLVYDATCS